MLQLIFPVSFWKICRWWSVCYLDNNVLVNMDSFYCVCLTGTHFQTHLIIDTHVSHFNLRRWDKVLSKYKEVVKTAFDLTLYWTTCSKFRIQCKKNPISRVHHYTPTKQTDMIWRLWHWIYIQQFFLWTIPGQTLWRVQNLCRDCKMNDWILQFIYKRDRATQCRDSVVHCTQPVQTRTLIRLSSFVHCPVFESFNKSGASVHLEKCCSGRKNVALECVHTAFCIDLQSKLSSDTLLFSSKVR